MTLEILSGALPGGQGWVFHTTVGDLLKAGEAVTPGGNATSTQTIVTTRSFGQGVLDRDTGVVEFIKTDHDAADKFIQRAFAIRMQFEVMPYGDNN